MANKLTVEFDAGQAGRRALRRLEERFGLPDNGDTGPSTLTSIWTRASDELIDAVIEEFKDGMEILEIALSKEE